MTRKNIVTHGASLDSRPTVTTGVQNSTHTTGKSVKRCEKIERIQEAFPGVPPQGPKPRRSSTTPDTGVLLGGGRGLGGLENSRLASKSINIRTITTEAHELGVALVSCRCWGCRTVRTFQTTGPPTRHRLWPLKTAKCKGVQAS